MRWLAVVAAVPFTVLAQNYTVVGPNGQVSVLQQTPYGGYGHNTQTGQHFTWTTNYHPYYQPCPCYYNGNLGGSPLYYGQNPYQFRSFPQPVWDPVVEPARVGHFQAPMERPYSARIAPVQRQLPPVVMNRVKINQRDVDEDYPSLEQQIKADLAGHPILSSPQWYIDEIQDIMRRQRQEKD